MKDEDAPEKGYVEIELPESLALHAESEMRRLGMKTFEEYAWHLLEWGKTLSPKQHAEIRAINKAAEADPSKN